ncbi:hypothetical protein HDE_13455 [Halotydeus destructor]|nr:hypothetical protein HDE_13455 [Halotydeus destructor]
MFRTTVLTLLSISTIIAGLILGSIVEDPIALVLFMLSMMRLGYYYRVFDINFLIIGRVVAIKEKLRRRRVKPILSNEDFINLDTNRADSRFHEGLWKLYRRTVHDVRKDN